MKCEIKILYMAAHLEPDVSLAMHEIIRDTCGRKEIHKRVRAHRRRLEEHAGVSKKDDSNADKVENQVLLHVIYIYVLLLSEKYYVYIWPRQN